MGIIKDSVDWFLVDGREVLIRHHMAVVTKVLVKEESCNVLKWV